MNLAWVEPLIRLLGGLFAFGTLGVILFGIWRGTRRQPGLTTGRMSSWQRSWVFYLLLTALFLALSILGWKPLPLKLSPQIRLWMLVGGSLLVFPGLGLVLWGRLVLGKNYFVSTGFGAQLFAGQQLITHGPFALVRHPMYTGLILAAFGSLLIYATWTALFFACFSPFLLLRARREETALALQFGEQWQAYKQRTPAFIPHIRHPSFPSPSL